MKATHFLKWAALATLALACLGARADDIDIYGGAAASGPNPNIIIILDTDASGDASYNNNCSFPAIGSTAKSFDATRCALYTALDAISQNLSLKGKLNIGLMGFGQTSNKIGLWLSPGPYPSSLPVMDAGGITTMKNAVVTNTLANIKSGGAFAASAFQESWAFYTGNTGLSGHSYAGNISQVCQKSFIIYIGSVATKSTKPSSGFDSGVTELNSAITTTNTATGSNIPPVTSSINTNGNPNFGPNTGFDSKSWMDEWARFLSRNDLSGSLSGPQNIVTYTIAANFGGNPPLNADYDQTLTSTAYYGGGKKFVATDANSMVQALLQIFNEVQSVNSVFASASLPVSASAQGTYLNQVFMGSFRPDPTGAPRWKGNLKQYQFGVDLSNQQSPQLFLADATGKPALSSAGTGFITSTAVSFWTGKDTSKSPDAAPTASTPGTNGFWVNNPASTGAAFDLPDGEVVEKGGVGQQIRLANLKDNYTTNPTGPRNVYTCYGSSCTSGADLSTTPAGKPFSFSTSNTNLSATALGIAGTTPTATNLINWVRGSDNVGDEPSPGGGITIRPSVHGDVLHSRPAVINYGGSTGVVVFYGANDGMFRAINGNQPNNPSDTTKPLGSCTISSDCAIGGVPPGGELWSFVAPEFYPKLQRLYSNSPVVQLATTPSGIIPTPRPKDYFFDGTPGVYQNPNATLPTPKAAIFLSARRGGPLLYALDVSTPTAPKFMWKHTNADPGFSELGQTWSQPKVARIKGNANPVLIFGAGYNPAEDNEPPTAYSANGSGSVTGGRGIFIVDAVTGNMLWQAVSPSASCAAVCIQPTGMNYAIPADITLVDRNFDGYIDRLYASDVGGNIWRVDLEPVTGSTLLSDARVTLLAALGGSDATKRKMFFPPDVVLTKNYDAVVASTGDREHPLYIQKAQSVVNRFYMIKDTNFGMSAAGWTTVRDDTSSIADAQPPMLFNATPAPYDQSLSGFYITLPGAGEKGVNAPTTVGGTVYFGTNTPTAPSTTSCQGNLGTARGYAVNFVTGQSSSVKFDGGGLAPSPVFGVVDVTDKNGVSRQLPFMIGSGAGSTAADQKSSLGVTKPVIPVNVKKKRTYWYRDIDR